jgi:glycosyltransferase involved in cell wall biosynthesis
MSGRIDISVLGYDARGSGVVRNALRIAQAAQEAGLRVELWMARNNGNLGDSLPGTIPIRTYGTGPAGWGRMAGLALSVPSLARMIRKERPRLLLSSGNHMHLAAALAHHLAGRPRETTLVMRASNATWRRTMEASRGEGALGWVGQVIDAVNRLQYGAADHVVAGCEELRQALQNDIGLPAEKLSAVANGVDAEGLRARAAEPLDHPWLQASEAPLIVAVGRLSRQKNFEALLQAFARLRRQRPARLAIVGENIGGGETRLRALAASLGVADDVLMALMPTPSAG